MDVYPYVYLDSVNSNLICCICQTPFINPTSASTCRHTFCRHCITEALKHAPQCPVDRSPLTVDLLRPANSIVRNLVDELVVECIHRSFGCSYVCQRQLLPAHLKDECQYVETKCCEDQCGAVLMKKEVGKHAQTCLHRTVMCEACAAAIKVIDMETHSGQCPAQEVTCTHCGDIMARSELTKHNSECPDITIPCTHSENGCPWSGPRRTLDTSHIPACPYESIKGFFSVNAARISSLEKDNSALQSRIADLEHQLRVAKRDIETAHRSLGPWLRPDGAPPPEEVQQPPRQERSAQARRRVSTPLTAGLFGFSDPQSQSEPVETLQNPPGAFSGPFFPSDGFAGGNGDYSLPPPLFSHESGYPRASLPHTPVAPINYNTTLEGALSSLHSSIVTLSSSLDSLGRRQDITLTTETLRMHEEVGSLRAIVHGLRMQVHTIMMDRNPHVGENRPSVEGGYSSTVRYLNQRPPAAPVYQIPTTTTSIRRGPENRL